MWGLIRDVARVVTAPIEIASDVVRAVTKPAAEVAQDCVDVVKEELGVEDDD